MEADSRASIIEHTFSNLSQLSKSVRPDTETDGATDASDYAEHSTDDGPDEPEDGKSAEGRPPVPLEELETVFRV
jgi:hypothetical protein